MTTVDKVLARARSALDKHTVYWLDAGGLDPDALTPTARVPVAQAWAQLTPAKRAELAPLAKAMHIDVTNPVLKLDACDCSGFVCWALGFSRKTNVPGPYTTAPERPGGDCWIYTGSIYADAKGQGMRFRHVTKASPGALVVYPKGPTEDFGHIAIVVAADADGRATQIIHCSKDNVLGEPHDGIKITTAEKFEGNEDSIYVWCRDVAES
jgi:hypothetical protein